MSEQYICPNCEHIFVISTIASIKAKRTIEGKIVKCPRCGHEGVFERFG